MPATLARHQAFSGNEPYFPWSAWAGDALWQLLPSDRMMHQRQKRDRLTSAVRLQSAQDWVQVWWEEAYLQALNPILPVRFTQKACASLPGLLSVPVPPALDDCFTALLLQQARLKHDQQVPKWRDLHRLLGKSVLPLGMIVKASITLTVGAITAL